MTKTMLYHPNALSSRRFCHPDAGGICDPSADRSDASFLSMTKTMLLSARRFYHPDAFCHPDAFVIPTQEGSAILVPAAQMLRSSA